MLTCAVDTTTAPRLVFDVEAVAATACHLPHAAWYLSHAAQYLKWIIIIQSGRFLARVTRVYVSAGRRGTRLAICGGHERAACATA